MNTTNAPITVPVETSLLDRIGRGVRYMVSGIAPGEWFGPGQPAQPLAPKEIVDGRQFDMPVAVNTTTSRKTEGFTFDQLRAFAESCEVVRLLIERRKDQVCALPWTIRPKKKGKPGEEVVDKRIEQLTAALQKPDAEHTWDQWLRMLLEDLFVLDAPALFIQRTYGRTIYALRPVDGGTIKRLLDERGWTPIEGPAYQQILRGMAAIDYTTDELIYRPRNPRTHKIYGYSPVEQIATTAQLFLSRALSNLEFYQTGNLPEGFLEGGKDWTPEQIVAFQKRLDTLLSGSYAERRKVRVVPQGAKYTPAKEPALKTEFDEWLARIACFAFSYPPQAFVKEMNRATSETAKEAAEEEGVQPLKQWVKGLLDEIVQVRYGFADLEFVFGDEEAQDPSDRAAIDKIYLDAKVLHPDEVRADLGKPPLTPEQKLELNPPPPPELGGDPEGGSNGGIGGPGPGKPGKPKPDTSKADDAKGDDAAKLAKGEEVADDGTDPFADGLPPVDLDRPAAKHAEDHLVDALETALEAMALDVAGQVETLRTDGATDATAIADAVALDWSELEAALLGTLTDVAQDSAQAAVAVLEDAGASVSVTTSLINEGAGEWAKTHAAELIGTDAKGGLLDDVTRMAIRKAVTEALEAGEGSRQLARRLRDEFAFGAARARTIARTELAAASVNGALVAWRESGVVMRKRWSLAEAACAVCAANAAQGELPLLVTFASGDQGPPGHPNCRCSLIPITR